jgi:hypothetical protein
MLHQADTSPLAVLNVNPLARYYGSITTSGVYPVVASELWHWTGDKVVRPFVDPALRALRWLDEYSDADRDGFYEYMTVVDLRFHRTKSGQSSYEVLDKRGPLHIVRQPSPWSLTATFGERLQDALTSLL